MWFCSREPARPKRPTNKTGTFVGSGINLDLHDKIAFDFSCNLQLTGQPPPFKNLFEPTR